MRENPTSKPGRFITRRLLLILFVSVLLATLCACGDSFGAAPKKPLTSKARPGNLQSNLNSLLSGGGSGAPSGVGCEDNPDCYCDDECYCEPNDCRCEDDGGGG